MIRPESEPVVMDRLASRAPAGNEVARSQPRIGLPSGGRVLTPSFVTLVAYVWLVYSYKLPGVGLWIGAALVTSLLQPGKPRLPPPLLWFGGFIAWAGVASIGSVYPEVVHKTLGDFMKFWLIFFACFNTLRKPSQVRAFMICNLAIFALYPIRGLFANVAGGHSESGRYAWNFIFSNPNDFATLSLPMFGLVLVALNSAVAVWQRRAALLGAIVIPVAIIFTGSRGGFLGLLLFAGLVLLRSRRKGRTLALGLVAAIAIAISAPPATWERMSSIANMKNKELVETQGDESQRQRYIILQIAFQMWKDHPIFGVGLGAAKYGNAAYAPTKPEWSLALGRWNTHNLWLNIMAETGTVGMVLFGCMLWSVWRRLRLTRRTVRGDVHEWASDMDYLETALLAFMVSATFGVVHAVPFVYFFFALCWLLATTLLDAYNRGITAPPPAPSRQRVRR